MVFIGNIRMKHPVIFIRVIIIMVEAILILILAIIFLRVHKFIPVIKLQTVFM